MFKTFIAATFMLLGSFGLANAGSVKTDMLDPVVKINNNCSAESVKIPEGKRLLTAAHCVDGKSVGTYFVESRNNKNEVTSITHFYFDVVRVDKEKDLALLKVRDDLEVNIMPVANVAEKTVAQEGDQVWTVGYPLAFNRVITEGLFNQPLTAAFTPSGKEQIRYRASPGIDGGNSGGALFQKNGDKYEIIGITSMKFRSNSFMGIYVPLSDIREFLRLDIGKANTLQIDQR